MKLLENDLKRQLDRIFGKNIRYHEFLKFHTTFGIGGPADFYITPFEFKNLVEGIKLLKELHIPVMVLGSGSNVLVKDTGVKGSIFNMKNLADYIIKKDESIFAGAGTALSRLVNFAAEQNLSGLEWASSIPGTVGGAVKGNAGAFGSCMGDLITGVDGLFPDGSSGIFEGKHIKFSYRSTDLPENLMILNTSFRLKKGKKEKILTLMKEYTDKRIQSQPIERRSAGSVFKNPEKGFAGELIERAGLKGYSFKGARISEKHANFIVNENNASATDVLNLIDLIITTIFNMFNIRLELEIKVLGE